MIIDPTPKCIIPPKFKALLFTYEVSHMVKLSKQSKARLKRRRITRAIFISLSDLPLPFHSLSNLEICARFIVVLSLYTEIIIGSVCVFVYKSTPFSCYFETNFELVSNKFCFIFTLCSHLCGVFFFCFHCVSFNCYFVRLL